MSTIAGRVFRVARAAFSRRTSVHSAAPIFGSVRPLALSSQTPAWSKHDDKEVNNEPIKFSTSKASHRTWKVDRSMGSQFERPWWKIVPISVVCITFLLWCALRGQTDIDSQLEKQLYEHLPGLLPDEEEEDVQNKTS